jgi:hypothetical protein
MDFRIIMDIINIVTRSLTTHQHSPVAGSAFNSLLNPRKSASAEDMQIMERARSTPNIGLGFQIQKCRLRDDISSFVVIEVGLSYSSSLSTIRILLLILPFPTTVIVF